MDPAESVHQKFLAAVRDGNLPLRSSNVGLNAAGIAGERLVELVRSQILSRQLDRCSRKLAGRGESFYTIGSAGHEGNAAFAEALRMSDMAFLHYRDAAFQVHRGRQVPGMDPVWDMLLSFVASSDDPISRGRHKVLGSKALNIPPQTSTIASHLPKAVGAALSIDLARALELDDAVLPDDAVIYCTFGDASANHSTALGAINHAMWQAYQDKPVPIVFLCQDNGIGISTRTPTGWIEAAYGERTGLKYIKCDGIDLLDSLAAAREAVDYARTRRKPVFVHMRTARLYGHAGSDVQLAYLSKSDIDATEAADPLLLSARILADTGLMSLEHVLHEYESADALVMEAAERAISRPKLTTAAQVMSSLVPPKRVVPPPPMVPEEKRAATFGLDAKQMEKPQHMARLLSWALTDLMLQHPNIIVAGEDVGPKGGVYNVTGKLHARFGPDRVINTLLDEQSILGLGIGAAHNGILPITEIQFLAYVHNAEDQLRGEAATLSFFSDGQYTNPMIVRIAGLPYQKGFGGHFHNDNSLAIFRDIPGVILAVPSNGRDAVRMLRECVRLAREEQRVVVFVEPIALYMTRDLHEEGDGLWTALYPSPDDEPLPLGSIAIVGDGTDLAIVTYGNGFYLSRQAQKMLEERGINARVIDLRWLAPLNEDALVAAVAPVEKILIVDECRITGSQSEALMALFAEQTPDKRVRRIAADDSFIPLGKAATLTLPSRDSIVAAALDLVGKCTERRRRRALVVCPGRGVYNKPELGYFQRHHATRASVMDAVEAERARLSQGSIRELDAGESFSHLVYSRGDNASPLIFACSYADFLAIDREAFEIVGITGNSMGWYTALACAGALPLEKAIRLVNGMGALMHEMATGGQVVYPLVDEDWRAIPGRREELMAIVAQISASGLALYVSIELGGMILFAGEDAALAELDRLAPRGPGRLPMRLQNHGAFHSPLMQAISDRARTEMPAAWFEAPAIPLVDGSGRLWEPGQSDPTAIWDYTLGAQVTETYDFTAAIARSVHAFDPEVIIVLGPGDTLGGAVAQSLIRDGWSGLTDRASFTAMQIDAPRLLAMGRPDQRALSVRHERG